MNRSRRDREETAQLLALVWPCILENLTTTLVSLVDTAMVGSIGAVATAAVGLCSSPVWLMNGLARSLGVGDTARPFLYSLVTMWGVRMAVSLLLGFALGMGANGVYFAMLVDLAVRSALLLRRFARGVR